MNRVLPRYLHTYRKRWCLTQKELSFLLGLTSGDSVAKYERSKRTPSLPVAIACSVLFDQRLDELFPGEYKKVEQIITKRMRRLCQELDKQPTSKMNTRKQQMLTRTIKRMLQPSQNDV